MEYELLHHTGRSTPVDCQLTNLYVSSWKNLHKDR